MITFAITQRRLWPLQKRQRPKAQWFIAWYGSLGVGLLCIASLSFGLRPSVLQAQSCIAKNILFVAASTSLEGRDEPLRLYLSASGHNVTVHSGAVVQTADAAGKDLIIISESVESMEVHTKFRDVAVPIITWEAWLQDDLGMTGPEQYVDYGENLRQQDIYIVNSSHPLAAGLSGVVATTQSKRNKFHWGIPNANAAIVAVDIDSDQHAMLYAYERGAQMVGLSAPARRVFMHNATGSNLTMAGWRLFDAAVAWALDCSGEQPTATPSTTPTATPTSPLTATATNTLTPTLTLTPTATATTSATVTPPFTATPSPSPTHTMTATPSATPTATATAMAAVQLAFQKQDLLFIDADEDGFVSRGDTLLYVIDIRNTGPTAVTGLALEDVPDANTTLIAGTVRTDRGTVRIGNGAGDSHVVVDIGDLASQEAVRILFQVQVQATENVSNLRNQAQVRYVLNNPTGQGQLLSDDPDTTENNDATTTPLNQPAAPVERQLYLPVIAK